MAETIFVSMTDDGVTIDVVVDAGRRFYNIRADGTTFSRAMIPQTAQMAAEEALKCWNEEPGRYTYEGENPFPQLAPAMMKAFPQHTEAIAATVTRRRSG